MTPPRSGERRARALSKGVVWLLAWSLGMTAAPGASADMPRLEIRNGRFENPSGARERFWGVNLVSAFPSRAEAELLADNLASLGVNLVRHHHLMRPSKDWVWRAPCAALARYDADSRAPDPEAWDRFDHLNAALRERGIRIVLSMHFTRKFLPGDAAIDPGGDAGQWADAIRELNAWPWQESFDPVKLLPVIDRRARLLQKEFVRRLLSRRNPHSGLTYGEDPQVLYLETVNESSLEYAILCNNRFPGYFERRLQALWRAHAAGEGVATPGDLRAAGDDAGLSRLRSGFFRGIEDEYFRDMRAFARECGSPVPVVCCNVWRGNDILAAGAAIGDVVEDHLYVDPLVVRGAEAWMDLLARTRVDGKPFFLGEFNHWEDQEKMRQAAFARPMLMLSAAAYGAFHDLDGVVWFAFSHGDRHLGADGWAKAERREPSPGDMVCDGVMLDHLATCSALFRGDMLRPAAAPRIRDVAIPVHAAGYAALMADPGAPPPGAQSLRSHRKRFVRKDVAVPAGDAGEERIPAEMKVHVADTGEIVRDLAKRQLSVVTPGGEAFSGFLDAGFPRRFIHLSCPDTDGFATVVAVAADGRPMAASRAILVSRTWMDADGNEKAGLRLSIKGLNGERNGRWKMRVCRPRAAREALRDLAGGDVVTAEADAEGTVILPRGTWTQMELSRSEDEGG
jgi:hypothetical protein